MTGLQFVAEILLDALGVPRPSPDGSAPVTTTEPARLVGAPAPPAKSRRTTKPRKPKATTKA